MIASHYGFKFKALKTKPISLYAAAYNLEKKSVKNSFVYTGKQAQKPSQSKCHEATEKMIS